jgi:hypothetical protein
MANRKTIPTFLFDTYSRYKLDTSIFVSWLGETARKCGYFANDDSTNVSGKKKTKPGKKGTGKKKAKAHLNSTIPLNDFPALAAAIADSEPEIPLKIVVVLKHIIKARGECADWFSHRTLGEEEKESNESHRHVISIFKTVLEVLLPKMESKSTDRKVSVVVDGSGKKLPIELANSFAGLDIEDPPSEFEDEVFEKPTVKKTKSYERTYTIEDQMADYIMEIFFFFHDLNNVRKYLKQIWQDYEDGRLDLTVSFVAISVLIQIN